MFGDFPRQFWGKEQATGQFRPQAVRLDTSLEGTFTDFSGSSRFILRLQGHVLGWGVFGHVLKKDEARSRVRARLCRIQESGVDCEGRKKHFKSIIAALLHSREHTCVCGKSLCHGVSQPVLLHCVQSPSWWLSSSFHFLLLLSVSSDHRYQTVGQHHFFFSCRDSSTLVFQSHFSSLLLFCCATIWSIPVVFKERGLHERLLFVLPCCNASLSGLYVS